MKSNSFSFPENPFWVGGPVKPDSNVLAPRRKVFSRICKVVESGGWTSIIGARMVGKTTLLYQLYSYLGQDHCLYLDGAIVPGWYGEETHISKTLESIQYYLYARANYEPMPQPPENGLQFIRNLQDLSKNKYDNNLIILFDEFEPTIQFLQILRYIHQSQIFNNEGRITLVTAGVTDPSEIDLGPTSPFNVSEIFLLDCVETDEAHALIRQGFNSTGITLDDVTLESIIRASGCLPALIQSLCRWLYEKYDDEIPVTIHIDYEALIEQVVKSQVFGRFFYPDIYLNDHRILEIVCQIIEGNPPPFSLLRPVIRRGWQIYGLFKADTYGMVDFISPLHRYYVSQHISMLLEDISSGKTDNKLMDVLQRHETGILNFMLVSRQEMTMNQENINVNNVVGMVNLKSRLKNVEQSINNSALPSEVLLEWSSLVKELNEALEKIPKEKSEDTERVIQSLETIGKEISKQEPNKRFLVLSAEGLKEAASALQSIAPSVLIIASKIILFVSQFIK